MSWKEFSIALMPEPRYGHAGVYDSLRARGIVIGGTEFNNTVASHFLEWDACKWNVKPQADSPPPVAFPSMAYDNVRGLTILMAGDTQRNTMWEWNGVDWKEIFPKQMPPARVGGAFAFDSERQKVVLFGGRGDGTTFLNDTWEWDGVQWNQVITTTSPPARVSSAMSYDPLRKVSVLMGGAMNYLGRDFFGDTWLWDGAKWCLASSTGPKPRGGHALVFDDAQGYVFMFGGTTSKNGSMTTELLNDSWIWSGEAWIQVNDDESPSARADHMMFCDTAHRSILLFGGRTSFGGEVLNDTWIRSWD